MRVSVKASILLLISLLLLTSCTSVFRLDAVPTDRFTDAVIPGMPNIRFFINKNNEPFIREGYASLEKEKAHLLKTEGKSKLPPANYLALSGGGDNGAFGAGLLHGWTKIGSRPEFKIVTGVSTGALIAPFAFLGPEYDEQLKEVYTQTKPEDIATPRWFLNIVLGDSAADNAAMWKLINRFATQEMLQKIGEEYDKGRLLLVATTNLDAQRPIVWNIGAIAKSGHPNALKLFQSVLVASASIPGAFSPVMLDVEVDGKKYQEMHVDGGAASQVFIYPASVNLKEEDKTHNLNRERNLYVIRNARLDPEWAAVERNIFNIAERAITSLIQSQGIGDLYRIYLAAERDGLNFNLAYIPSSFKAEHKQEFDTVYMNKLFDRAEAMTREGFPWEKYPPGFNPTE